MASILARATLEAAYLSRLQRTLAKPLPCLNVYDARFSQEVNTHVFYWFELHACFQANCKPSECSRVHVIVSPSALGEALTRVEMAKSIHASPWVNGLILWSSGRACERRVRDVVSLWAHVFCT
jgi:hypothetical protein